MRTGHVSGSTSCSGALGAQEAAQVAAPVVIAVDLAPSEAVRPGPLARRAQAAFAVAFFEKPPRVIALQVHGFMYCPVLLAFQEYNLFVFANMREAAGTDAPRIPGNGVAARGARSFFPGFRLRNLIKNYPGPQDARKQRSRFDFIESHKRMGGVPAARPSHLL